MRRVPVQGQGTWNLPRVAERPTCPPGTITWEEHVKAWEGYARRYGTSQSAELMAARGGFGYFELLIYLGDFPATWVARTEAPHG